MSTGFNLGPFTIHYYGLVIIAGILIALVLVKPRSCPAGKIPGFPARSSALGFCGGCCGSPDLAYSDPSTIDGSPGDHHPVLSDPFAGCDRDLERWYRHNWCGPGRVFGPDPLCQEPGRRLGLLAGYPGSRNCPGASLWQVG